jgi:nitric oxide reductase activation protein
VRAAAGQQNVRTQSLTLPQTSFRASVAVDLSGSMSSHIQSGALYDSMMVLGDTFELLDIPYESRAFGSTDAQFKSMDEPTFNPARAAALTETNLGGTQLASTASLAMTALRGGAEANRLFVSLTDGDLGDQAATAAVLKDARKRGIVTFGIFLGHGANKESMDDLWGAGNWTQINALEEMPKAVGQRLAALFNRLAQR